ncbi:MAG: hypothetical protein APU95_00180 [Hadesarchaea archaeon YNP_N21]|jgi:hypothetical protein|nr:MAG: hypothetical protein APU95_00180 [Hadesarchaea archaeon YNP_N21]
MGVESQLVDEIAKWSARLSDELRKIKPADGIGKNMKGNIEAYVEDSKHFFKAGDLVKSFECLVWAWAWLEIGVQLGHLARDEDFENKNK